MNLQAGLQQLGWFKELHYAQGAGYDDRGQITTRCLEGTRKQLLGSIKCWLHDGTTHNQFFWLEGMAGTGKSTVAKTVAAELAAPQFAVGSFFFQRGGGDCSKASNVVDTFVLQLAAHRELRSIFADAIAESLGVTSKNLEDRWKKLVRDPLAKKGATRIVLVIDAVDECEDGLQEKNALMRLLSDEANFKDLNMKIFVTARSGHQIPVLCRGTKVMLSVDEQATENDIRLYLKDRIRTFQVENEYEWPNPDQIIEVLTKRSTPLFIAAVASFDLITGDKHDPETRFDHFCRNTDNTSPESGLDNMYITIIRGAVDDGDKTENFARYHTIVGSVLAMKDFLSPQELSKLLRLKPSLVHRFLRAFSAVLLIHDIYQPVRILHGSFHDFILNKERYEKASKRTAGGNNRENLWVNEKEVHVSLFGKCLSAMEFLKQDICDLRDPGAMALDVTTEYSSAFLPTYVRYALRYWMIHFIESDPRDANMQDQTLGFLRKHFLHWIEAMSILKSLSEVIRLLHLLGETLAVSNSSN